VKSVQSDSFLQENDKLILQTLYDNKSGLIVKNLEQLTGLHKRNIYKRLNILKEKEIIEHIYPIWKIINGQYNFVHSLLKETKLFELHNLSYVLKLVKTPDWWDKRKPRLSKINGWNFKEICFGKENSNPYSQLINENFVIQTYPESIIIISRKRYYSNNPYELIIEAINDVLNIITYFEEKIKFKLFPDEIPALELRGNDFNRIKDQLAEHCKKEGRRFLVELDKNRKIWVDYSEPFGKEANYPEGQETLEKVTKDHLINRPLLNSELQLLVQQVTNNQIMMDKNVVKHFEVLNKIGDTTEELRELIKILIRIFQK